MVTTPIVLEDYKGATFTEGDRVAYASANGIRAGIVEYIREDDYNPSRFKIWINMSEHHKVVGFGNMKAARVVYAYIKPDSRCGNAHHFMKL